ncbi:hypothetical protein PR048_016029 [Dryococelus australis]|uniref:Retroviral polymerase SH3-like domain-containing protein n=1 Tax=Dryococelus australis TaxID=614101 RepID=A0ABQ9HIK8_9NEOP|nr:hypothetical protein PR048_016029 [Dryococelus australis]
MPKEKTFKLDPKNKTGVFLGYDEDVKGYRVFIPLSNTAEVHYAVVFLLPECKHEVEEQNMDDIERCAGKEKEDCVQEVEEDVNERTGIQDSSCDEDLGQIAATERENEGIEGEGYNLQPRRNFKKPSFLEDYYLGLCNMIDDDPQNI